MTRIYSPFSESPIGTGLALTQGDTILQTSTTVNAHRIARSTIAQDSAVSAVEFLPWSPSGSPPSLSPSGGVPPLCYGIVTAAASLSKYVGEDAEGFSYCPGDGKVRNNGSVIATLATSGLGIYNYVVVDPINATVQFFKNNTPLGDPIAITAGQAWYYAASLSGDPGQLAVQAISGQTPMRYPLSDFGWWAPSPGIAPVLLGTDPYMSDPADDVPHEKYAGDIDRDQSPLVISDSVHFWMWGASAPAELGVGGLVQMQVNDPGDIHAQLLADEARNVRATLQRVQHDTAISTAENLFAGVLDHAERDTVQTKQVYLRDQSARLNIAIRRALYPQNADPSVAGKPRSMSLGICRNYEGDLVDVANRIYGCHDGAITAIGLNREAGKILVYGTDDTITADGSGFTFAADAQGVRTFETTSFGGAFNPVSPDYLSGAGDFETMTGDGSGLPPNWKNATSYNGLITAPTHDHRFFMVDTSYFKCVQEPTKTSITWLDDGGVTMIKAGRTYAYEIICSKVPSHGNSTNPPTYPAALLLTGTQNPTYVGGDFWSAIVLDNSTLPVTYRGTFTNTSTIDRMLGLGFICNNGASANFALDLVFNYLGIISIKLNEFPAVTDNVVLDGPGVDLMLRGVMVDRGPLAAGEYVAADAQAIDTATGYKLGIHVASSETPLVSALVDTIRNSVCSAVYNDDSGLFRAGRLFKPELVADGDLAGELTESDVIGELKQYPDLAENLTTRLSGCRNYRPLAASEYGASTLTDVPAAKRAQLGAQYQWTAAAGLQLAARYADAYNRDPLQTILDEYAHGQSEIAFVNSFYVVGRNFYVADFAWPFGREYKLLDTWRLTYPLPGLDVGQKLVIVGRQRKPPQELCKLILWGL